MTKILGADMLPLIRQKLPGKTSQLTNDSGFITSSSLSNLVPNTRTVNGKALSSDITLGAADVGALPTDGNAVSATKLATARTFRTNLASTSTASFNGTANVTPGVTGALPISNGGTGATTAAAALSALGGLAANDLKTVNSQSLVGNGDISIPELLRVDSTLDGGQELTLGTTATSATTVIVTPTTRTGLFLVWFTVTIITKAGSSGGTLGISLQSTLSSSTLAYITFSLPTLNSGSSTVSYYDIAAVTTTSGLRLRAKVNNSTVAEFNKLVTGENRNYLVMIG